MELSLLESLAWRRATECVAWVWPTTPLSPVGSYFTSGNYHNDIFSCVNQLDIFFHAAGILLLSGFQIDISEAKAFLHENNKIDIYSNSWGPIDNGKLVLGPGFVATIALALGAQQVWLAIINSLDETKQETKRFDRDGLYGRNRS